MSSCLGSVPIASSSWTERPGRAPSGPFGAHGMRVRQSTSFRYQKQRGLESARTSSGSMASRLAPGAGISRPIDLLGRSSLPLQP